MSHLVLFQLESAKVKLQLFDKELELKNLSILTRSRINEELKTLSGNFLQFQPSFHNDIGKTDQVISLHQTKVMVNYVQVTFFSTTIVLVAIFYQLSAPLQCEVGTEGEPFDFLLNLLIANLSLDERQPGFPDQFLSVRTKSTHPSL